MLDHWLWLVIVMPSSPSLEVVVVVVLCFVGDSMLGSCFLVIYPYFDLCSIGGWGS